MSESDATHNSKRARVLIVDDSSLVRLYYRQALETAGFEVDQAINGIEAFEKLLVQAFDLAIVDVNMPRMDGVSFLRALRKMTCETAELPALIVTTESSAEDAEDARAAGANFYLVKPVAEADLVHHAKALAGVPK